MNPEEVLKGAAVIKNFIKNSIEKFFPLKVLFIPDYDETDGSFVGYVVCDNNRVYTFVISENELPILQAVLTTDDTVNK